jgi:soluble cytochrome b562
MKLRPLASLLPLILGASLLHAQDMAPAAAPAAAAPMDGAAKPKKTPLAKDMDKMNAAFRKLRAAVKDPAKNDDAIALVATMKDAAQASISETPAFTSAQPEADQAKFVADFQAKMKDFIADLDKVTDALKAGDNATAATLVAALGKDERDNHKVFRKPESH